jgi:hypothetical protein
MLHNIPLETRIEVRLVNGKTVQGFVTEVTDHDLVMALHEKTLGHSKNQSVERIAFGEVESIVNLDQLAEVKRPVDLGTDTVRLTQGVTFSRRGPESAAAQFPQKGPGGVRRNKGRQYYVFAGPGTFGSESATYTIGGGGEWFLNRNAEGSSTGLAFGIEGSILGYPECGVCGGYLLGAFNTSYHFGEGKWVPFVTGGVGGAGSTEGGGVGLMNVGAGITYWFGRYGLRLELRDHVDFEFTAHNVSLRIGFTF